MPWLWIPGALAISTIAGALSLVLVAAARLRARHRRVLEAPDPKGSPDGTRLVDAPRALYHGTRFADGKALLAPRWADACVCDLWCTEEALFVRREGEGGELAVPLAAVQESTLHRAHAELAGKELPMLRLRWLRGGELLQTDVSLRGGMASLETLRREIHLRQGNIAAQLAPLLNRPPT